MIIVELYIPLADNDGRTFGADHHAAFEQVLTARFGGATRLPGSASGIWSDSGRTYRDDLVIYAVAVRSLLDGAVREAAEVAKAHYAQEAIFVRYLGHAEIV